MYILVMCECCKMSIAMVGKNLCYSCWMDMMKSESFTVTDQKCTQCGNELLQYEVDDENTRCYKCINGKCACGEENMPGEKMCYSCHYDALHHSQAEHEEFFDVHTVIDGEIIPEWALEDAYADRPLLRKTIHKVRLV